MPRRKLVSRLLQGEQLINVAQKNTAVLDSYASKIIGAKQQWTKTVTFVVFHLFEPPGIAAREEL